MTKRRFNGSTLVKLDFNLSWPVKKIERNLIGHIDETACHSPLPRQVIAPLLALHQGSEVSITADDPHSVPSSRVRPPAGPPGCDLLVGLQRAPPNKGETWVPLEDNGKARLVIRLINDSFVNRVGKDKAIIWASKWKLINKVKAEMLLIF